jgi:hypothetical protein
MSDPTKQKISSGLLELYKKQPWWVLVMLVTFPPAVSGFFSYQAAVVQAKTKAAEAKKTSEAGYEELAKAVETLQRHDEETAKTIAGLNGHIQSIESIMRDMRPHRESGSKETHLELPIPRGENKKNWRPVFPPKVSEPLLKKVDLPKSLDEASKK